MPELERVSALDHRLRPWVGGLRTASVLASGVAVAAVSLGAGCNDRYVSRWSIHNDTAIPVIFRDCSDHCSNPRAVPEDERNRDVWKPGEFHEGFDVSGVGVPSKTQVFDARDGRLIGCFYIRCARWPARRSRRARLATPLVQAVHRRGQRDGRRAVTAPKEGSPAWTITIATAVALGQPPLAVGACPICEQHLAGLNGCSIGQRSSGV